MMKTAPAYFGHKVDPERGEIVYLCLDRYIRLDGARNMLLSFDLRTEADVDAAIGELRRQLEKAGKSAKAALKDRAAKRRDRGG